MPTPAIKEVINNQYDQENYGEPDEEARRVNSQGEFFNEDEGHGDAEMDEDNQGEVEGDPNYDDEEFFQIDNHYALFSFYDDYKCLTHGEIYF